MSKNKIVSIILIISSIFLIDQISKKYIIEYFNSNNSIIYINSFLNFDLIWNKGIAFGLLDFQNTLIYDLITIIIGILILIIFYLLKIYNDLSIYYYSMIAGGAIGNLIDRIRFSAVPDFIDFHVGDYHWFVFNIADIFISIGVFCLIIAEILYKNKESNYE